MSIRVRECEFFVQNMRTRMPFRYGIATLRALPHLILRAKLEVEGKIVHGFAADGLAPKWFTKDPATTYAQDLADMLEVIERACLFAEEVEAQTTPFEMWRSVHKQQSAWARGKYPPLLWNFGVSFVERALIDAFCRATAQRFHQALKNRSLGLDVDELDLLPDAPLRSIIVRHTVGLSDPLERSEGKLADGLPETLVDSIRAYGLTHFKIKISGNIEQDLDRLRRVARVLEEHCPQYVYTLDGNENYRALEPFQELWEKLEADLHFIARLIFVEQPLHRDVALSPECAKVMRTWKNRPAMIIDESDAEPDSLSRAIESGYVGTSHKNCKGVFKGVTNACRIAQKSGGIMSAEDLANVGPVALLQDLAVVAALGIEHAERNGHHYFAGLSAFPETIQSAMTVAHPDLYQRHERGFAALRIENGSISTRSVNAAAFGVGVEPDVSQLVPLSKWDVASLEE